METNTKTKTDKTFLIEEAVAYVGMSRRTFERLNVPSREEFRKAKDGKSRKVRVYDQSELDRVKTERETPSHTPAVMMTTNANNGAQVVAVEHLQHFANFLVEKMAAANPKLLGNGEPDAADVPKKKTPVDISLFKDKLIMSFREARTFSGLTADELKHALEAGEISAKLVGKSEKSKGRWKIHRPSLEEFCKNYFE